MNKTLELFRLLKNGNMPSLMAAIVNFLIAIAKGVAFLYTGSVAMFAEMMHSLGDAANQFFVFIGSALSKKEPTERFPNGFGRLVNLVCLGAVLIVGYLSIQTVIHGFHQILHPEAGKGFWINIAVLALGVVLESFVLYKACTHVLHETNAHAKGLVSTFANGFANLSKATPATRLVFMEDLVATGGGVIAIVAIIIGHLLGFYAAEGIASVIIGVAMLWVVGKVFLENAAGALGEADHELEEKIGDMIMEDPEVKDIQDITVIKEGEGVHVEVEIEVDPNMTVAQADDIKDRIEEKILAQEGVTDVVVHFDEDDGIDKWNEEFNKDNDEKKVE